MGFFDFGIFVTGIRHITKYRNRKIRNVFNYYYYRIADVGFLMLGFLSAELSKSQNTAIKKSEMLLIIIGLLMLDI